MACYITGSDAPEDVDDLLEYLVERLQKAFPNFRPEQVTKQTYSVTVSFTGTGLDVDVVPILYYGDPDWRGNLINQDDGSFLETSIPLHLEFIRSRKATQERHFAQTIRLIKFWADRMKQERDDFRFKSFMIEMILCKLRDNQNDFGNYPEGLQHFFTYLAVTDIREQISFDDYYRASQIGHFADPIRIIDPGNPDNNVAALYTDSDADNIVGCCAGRPAMQ